jgi:hypothetical protein
MNIPVHFTPRSYQLKALKDLEAGVALSIWVWHRRSGKDLTAFSYAIKQMVKSPMNVVLVFPTKRQGKDGFWDNIENDGFKTLDHIPQEIIHRKDNTELKITLFNGSTFSLLGSGDPDSLRGANGKLYIFSEFVDIPIGAYNVIKPIVALNNGQVILQSTPKIDGISGGTFRTRFDRALANPKHHASLVVATENLSAEALEELRQDCIAENGNDFMYRQEFLCDFGQASSTSYYGQLLRTMENNGRIGHHPYNKKFPLYTAWDLGMSDSTAVTFFQYYDKQARIIDSYETHDIGDSAHVNFLKTKPYHYTWHFFPHDGAVRDSDAITRIEKIRELGLVNSSLLRREPVEDGIKRVVEELPKGTIHKINTLDLVRKLYMYKRKWNPLTGDYLGPEHKSESHISDSVRYMFTAIEQEFNKETCEMYISQVSNVDADDDNDDYSAEELPQTNFYMPS